MGSKFKNKHAKSDREHEKRLKAERLKEEAKRRKAARQGERA
jgi:hypothetical protein